MKRLYKAQIPIEICFASDFGPGERGGLKADAWKYFSEEVGSPATSSDIRVSEIKNESEIPDGWWEDSESKIHGIQQLVTAKEFLDMRLEQEQVTMTRKELKDLLESARRSSCKIETLMPD